MKQWKVKEFEKVLKYNNYEPVRQNGSHKIWNNGENTISVPCIKLMAVIANRLIKENNLMVKNM